MWNTCFFLTVGVFHRPPPFPDPRAHRGHNHVFSIKGPLLGLVWFGSIFASPYQNLLVFKCYIIFTMDFTRRQFTYLLLISGCQQIAHMTLVGRRRDRRGFGGKNQLRNIARRPFPTLGNNTTHLETALQLVCFPFRSSHFPFCYTTGTNSSVRAWQNCASS